MARPDAKFPTTIAPDGWDYRTAVNNTHQQCKQVQSSQGGRRYILAGS